MTRGSLPRTRLHLGTPDANDALVLAIQSRAAVLLAATGVPLHLVFVPEYPHRSVLRPAVGPPAADPHSRWLPAGGQARRPSVGTGRPNAIGIAIGSSLAA